MPMLEFAEIGTYTLLTMNSMRPSEGAGALDIGGQRDKQLLGSSGPSSVELVLLWLIAAVCFVVVVSHFQTYTARVDAFGDNGAYLTAAAAIQHWDFRAVQTKQFWGLPYLIACFSWLHLSARFSLLLICLASSL